MKNNIVSTKLSKSGNKYLSHWNEAISEAKRQIAELKRSIRVFQEMRDRGVSFPEPTSESEKELLGQKGLSGQSRKAEYQLHSVYLVTSRVLPQ